MNLDNCTIPLENNLDLAQSIALLDKFYQAGTILRNSNRCAARIADLVKSLKHYAGRDNDQATANNIHEGLEETLIIFENKLKNYQVVKEYQQLPEIDCHPIELEQVWTNILTTYQSIYWIVLIYTINFTNYSNKRIFYFGPQ